MYRKLEPKLISVFREGYTRQMFTGDLMGGLTVGVVALPLAIALAIASGAGMLGLDWSGGAPRAWRKESPP